MSITTGWYKLHRPRQLKDYVFQNDTEKDIFNKYVENKDIPDLMFVGHRGVGKTTLALLLKKELGVDDIDFLRLNAGDDNSVANIRNKVKPFMQQLSLGKFRLIFFDEACSLTPEAQNALKSMMEDEHRNARFIFTANHPHKIIPEIKSRCTEFVFNGTDKKDMLSVGLKILSQHGLALNVDTDGRKKILDTLNQHLDSTYPDFRKFITSLEQHYTNNQLLPPTYNENDLELMAKLILNIERGDWKSARDLIYQELPTDDISRAYMFIDQNLSEMSGFSENIDRLKKAYGVLAMFAYRNQTIALPELNLTACIIKLCDLLGDNNE